MNCQQTRDLIEPFLKGTLDRNTMRQVRGHLAACRECASRLDPQDFMEILPALDDSIEPSEAFAARFYTELRARGNQDPAAKPSPAYGMKQSWASRWSWGLAAAAVLAIVVAGGLFLRQSQNRTPDTAEVLYDLDVTENLPLLKDMALISNLDFFEDMDAIENMPQMQ